VCLAFFHEVSLCPALLLLPLWLHSFHDVDSFVVFLASSGSEHPIHCLSVSPPGLPSRFVSEGEDCV